MTPNSRRAFEKHINMLSENMRKGRFRLPPDRRMLNSLLNTRKAPNGRVNFLTIDESVRLLANTFANMDSPEFKKQIETGDEKQIES